MTNGCYSKEIKTLKDILNVLHVTKITLFVWEMRILESRRTLITCQTMQCGVAFLNDINCQLQSILTPGYMGVTIYKHYSSFTVHVSQK